MGEKGLFLQKIRSMQIAILANDDQKQAWVAAFGEGDWLWCGSVRALAASTADVYVDMSYHKDPERDAVLMQRSGALILVNEVVDSVPFARFNGWNGFLKRAVWEIAGLSEDQKAICDRFFETIGKQYRVVPDVPGMIGARVVACIINEAYITAGDGISSKEDIDIAMKLGTGYPYGPFEWAESIGKEQVFRLMKRLATEDSRYTVAPLLINECVKIQG